MADLSIRNEELNQLDEIVGNIPTKYGLPIVKFFQLVSEKRKAEETHAAALAAKAANAKLEAIPGGQYNIPIIPADNAVPSAPYVAPEPPATPAA